MENSTIILGGGTFEHIRNHFAVAAPAYGSTAKYLHSKIPDSVLVLTKMANPSSSLETSNDVSKFIDVILEDQDVKCLILNVAFCDFKPIDFDGISCGKHSERLKSDKNVTIEFEAVDKIIRKIRLKRPDIFLVGFKTTTNKTSEEQFSIALKSMKSVKCNLMFANDTVTRNNMIITAEETIYGETTDRKKALNELAEIISLRKNLTYNRSNFIQTNHSFSIVENTPPSFQKVIKFLIENGGFISDNGNDFTPSHFCYKLKDNSFISSQRKANHNRVFEEGMSIVTVEEDDNFVVVGKRKASVGARSQYMLFNMNPELNCIVHTHNPLKESSDINKTHQKPFQCGSIECGLNTVNNLRSYENDLIKAVYLEKHGANIMFNSKTDPDIIIEFIKKHIELGKKVR